MQYDKNLIQNPTECILCSGQISCFMHSMPRFLTKSYTKSNKQLESLIELDFKGSHKIFKLFQVNFDGTNSQIGLQSYGNFIAVVCDPKGHTFLFSKNPSGLNIWPKFHALDFTKFGAEALFSQKLHLKNIIWWVCSA